MALSVVVFPQPDGPRNTINSLSLTARLRLLTATTSSKCLVRFSTLTSAIFSQTSCQLGSQPSTCVP